MGEGAPDECPAVGRYVRPRDLVDRQLPVVFWSENFSVVSVSSLLSVLDGPHPRVCFELDRRIFATTVCVSGANHVSGGWGSGDAGWNHVVYLGLDIEVAHECSSIRSSLMLVVTTMVLAHLSLNLSTAPSYPLLPLRTWLIQCGNQKLLASAAGCGLRYGPHLD